MFQQYQNGIQPVSGLSEAGANIGQMYGAGFNALGSGLAEGIKQYKENKDLNDAADEKLDLLAHDFAQRHDLFNSNPEFAGFAKQYEPYMTKMAKGHSMGLSQKLALLHEVETLNSRTDKDLNIYAMLQASRARQLLPEGVTEANNGTVRTSGYKSNPNDLKYNPYLTYDQNEQSARKYYNDLVKANPSVTFKSEDEWIDTWRKALPKVVSSDETLHPAIRARAIEQISNAEQDIDAGPDSNLIFYLDRYSSIPVTTSLAEKKDNTVTTATPNSAATTGQPQAPTGIPAPASAGAQSDSAPFVLPYNPSFVPPAPTAIAPAAPAPAVAPPVALQPPASQQAASTPVVPPRPMVVAPQAPSVQVLPKIVPAPNVKPSAASKAPSAPAGLPAPDRFKGAGSNGATKASTNVSPSSSSADTLKQREIDRIQKLLDTRESQMEDSIRTNGPDHPITQYNIDQVKQLEEELNAVKEMDSSLFQPTEGEQGDTGTKGESGTEGDLQYPESSTPEPTPSAISDQEQQPDVTKQRLGREIRLADNSKLYGDFVAARDSREYYQSLKNNVDIGTGSALPTGSMNQAVKENPDLWRSLAVGTRAALDIYGGTRAIGGIRSAWGKMGQLSKLPEVTKGNLDKLITEEMNRLISSSGQKLPMLADGSGVDVGSKAFQSLLKKASTNIQTRGGNLSQGILRSYGNAIQGVGMISAATLINNDPEDKFDLPDSIRKTGPLWDNQYGGKHVSSTLDEIRTMVKDPENLTAVEKVRVSNFLAKKIAEQKANEATLHSAWQKHWRSASPEADKAAFAGAELPEEQRLKMDLGGPVDSLVKDEQPEISMPSMNMGIKQVRIAPSIDEKRQSLLKFYQSRLGYVPSNFEEMFKHSYPEAQLAFQETPYGVMMHDGKEWKPLQAGKTLQPHEISANRAVTFGTMLPNGDFRGEELMPNSGIRISGIGAFGTPSDATKFRQEYPKLIRAKNSILELAKINQQFGKSMDLAQRGRAAIKVKELIAQLRTDIVGVGTVSNFEQGILQDIIQNPTDFFHMTSTTKAKYDTLAEQVMEALHTMPAQYGLTVDMKEDKAKEIDAARAFYRQYSKK